MENPAISSCSPAWRRLKLGKTEGGKSYGKKKKKEKRKASRGLFIRPHRATPEFKRNGIHIRFHILPGQMGTFPDKCFLHIRSQRCVRTGH